MSGGIVWVTIEGIANGYDDGTFRPDRDVSRQVMATYLHRQQLSSEWSELLPDDPPLGASLVPG